VTATDPHPYVPPNLLSVVKDADPNHLEAEIDRLSTELSLSRRDVKVERTQVERLTSVLNHEQGLRENLERELETLREQVKLFGEWRASDGNTILALTRENASLTSTCDALSESLRRAG